MTNRTYLGHEVSKPTKLRHVKPGTAVLIVAPDMTTVWTHSYMVCEELGENLVERRFIVDIATGARQLETPKPNQKVRIIGKRAIADHFPSAPVAIDIREAAEEPEPGCTPEGFAEGSLKAKLKDLPGRVVLENLVENGMGIVHEMLKRGIGPGGELPDDLNARMKQYTNAFSVRKHAMLVGPAVWQVMLGSTIASTGRYTSTKPVMTVETMGRDLSGFDVIYSPRLNKFTDEHAKLVMEAAKRGARPVEV